MPLSKLVLSLESGEDFQIKQLYDLAPAEFDLVIEIIKE